jgi:hypothetical protein
LCPLSLYFHCGPVVVRHGGSATIVLNFDRDAEQGAGPNDRERRSGVSCIRASLAALPVIGQLGR